MYKESHICAIFLVLKTFTILHLKMLELLALLIFRALRPMGKHLFFQRRIMVQIFTRGSISDFRLFPENAGKFPKIFQRRLWKFSDQFLRISDDSRRRPKISKTLRKIRIWRNCSCQAASKIQKYSGLNREIASNFWRVQQFFAFLATSSIVS